MRRAISICVVAAMLAACAGRPQPDNTPVSATPGHPLPHPRVEIFYNAEPELVVRDSGAIPAVGLIGLLGPVGALAAMGVDALSRGNATQQAGERSQRFTQAVRGEVGDLALNHEYAQRLAEALRSTGREVKLTPAARALGTAGELHLEGLMPTPGHDVLLLRISTAYWAPDLGSSFRPYARVEYALRDDQLAPLAWDSVSFRSAEPRYYAYDTLLKENRTAYDGLRQALFATLPGVMRKNFPSLLTPALRTAGTP